jgi:hypothetical protein
MIFCSFVFYADFQFDNLKQFNEGKDKDEKIVY